MKKLRNVFADTMLEIGKADPRLSVLVGDISHGILQPFAEACPGRYYNVGICEPTIVSMAAGFAKTGLIPVVHTIAPFIIERGYEQIKLDFGYQNLFGNLISVGATFDYAQLGCSHHCYTDISLMSHIPGSQVFYPGSEVEFKALFQQSYDQRHLNYFRLPDKSHSVPFIEDQVVIGKAIEICKGSDATILVSGGLLDNAIEARNTLVKKGIQIGILYFPTIKPFDQEALQKVASHTNNILVLEEGSRLGGIYNYALDALKDYRNITIDVIAIERFVHSYGTYEELCDEVGLSPEKIISKIYTSFSLKYLSKEQEVCLS